VSRNDSRLLVVSSGVSSQLEDLSGKVLEDGGEVDGSSGSDLEVVKKGRRKRVSKGRGGRKGREGEDEEKTHSLSVVSLLEKSVNSTNGELKSGLEEGRRKREGRESG